MSEIEGGKKGMPAWAWVLIGCGGVVLLGVVAVVALGIIGAAGMTRARSAAYQANAVGMMRAYSGAQAMYHRNDWDGNGILEYATPYTKLYSAKDSGGNEAMLIDAAFAAANGPGGTPKQGYLFQDLATAAGQKIDWVNDFGLCGLPAPGGKLPRTFIVGIDGTVYGRDQGPGAGFVTDRPADPATAGWIAEF